MVPQDNTKININEVNEDFMTCNANCQFANARKLTACAMLFQTLDVCGFGKERIGNWAIVFD